MTSPDKNPNQQLTSRILLLNAKMLGLVLGLITGLFFFVATNWLVIKGGKEVGPHLQLLGQYFIGYRVSFPGSFLGFIYGFILGGAGGLLIGWTYNRIVHLKK